MNLRVVVSIAGLGRVLTDSETGKRIAQNYKDGVLEIGVTPKGVIDHRFFRPNN